MGHYDEGPILWKEFATESIAVVNERRRRDSKNGGSPLLDTTLRLRDYPHKPYGARPWTSANG
jgi:hypothetical protein